MIMKGCDSVVSPKKRASNNRWDSENMTVLGVKVRKDYAEEVKRRAKERGDTVNAILKETLENYMMKY